MVVYDEKYLKALDENISGQGIVTKTTLDNTTTAKITGMVSSITTSAKSVVRDLDPINDLRFLRMRSNKTEILIAPDEDYILIVLQTPPAE